MRNGRKILLAHDRRSICGKIADYRLIKVLGSKGEYVISIIFCEQMAMHRMWGKISDVVILYDLIVRNTVTPCTLGDVVEDIAYKKG